MATQEKLLKSLETLKSLSLPNQHDYSKKKDKIHHCHIVAETISNSTIKIAPNFSNYLSLTVEILLQMCEDEDSDTRMVAEECLNRIIRSMNDGNMGKVLIELNKGIKKNGSARSLRAALWRFSQLVHLIRPHKGKAYVANVFPTIIKISERSEEQIHETLATSLSKIMEVLGNFTTENETKALLKAFLKNVPHQSAVIRRTTANCILSICVNCRKPQVFLAYCVNHLLGLLPTESDNTNNSIVLGVMVCLKSLLPCFKKPTGEQELQGYSASSSENERDSSILESFLQIYELCLYNLANKDHNIINASLETLNILLQHDTLELKKALLSPNGICKNRMAQSLSLHKLRTPSQLSVSTNSALDDIFVESELTDTIRSDVENWIDQSKLSVMNITYAKPREIIEKSLSVDTKSTSIDLSLSDLDGFESKIGEFAGGRRNESIEDNLDKLTLSDKSDQSVSGGENERTSDECNVEEVHIGTILDRDVPLIYCARYILKRFLLNGRPGVCISDRTVRVSVKSLALSCLSSILKLYPRIFVMYLDKEYDSNISRRNISSQQISDVMLYENHPDPQLRGNVRMLTSAFIMSVLLEGGSNYENWLRDNSCVADTGKLQVDFLINIFIKGLQDESSSCLKQTLISLHDVIESLLESYSNKQAVAILNILPHVSQNPYWLVKVALCEVVVSLPYVTVHDITGTGNLQCVILHNVLFELLRDNDMRVRRAAANGIVNVIPKLYYDKYQCSENTVTRKAIYYKNLYLSRLHGEPPQNSLNDIHLLSSMPFPLSEISDNCDERIEFSLSRIVTSLFNCLLTATPKHFLHGCIETLALLSDKYPPTVYTKGWNCLRNSDSDDNSSNEEATLDLLNTCVNYLRHSVISYDLTCHLNLLTLFSNLYAAHALYSLRPMPEIENSTKLWDMFPDANYRVISENFLDHIGKLLNIFHCVIDEVSVVQAPYRTAMLSNLSSANAMSPLKRRKSDLDRKAVTAVKAPEKEDKDKKEISKPAALGTFTHLPHYVKIFDVLRSSYTNYKTSLDSEVCEKLLRLLRQTLKSFSIVMEIGSLVELQDVAEEILGYFRSTFSLESAATVDCVQQLLKCLFGTNLTSNVTTVKNICNAQQERRDTENDDILSFYTNISQKPYKDICSCFSEMNMSRNIEFDGDKTVMGYLHRNDVTKVAVPSRTSAKVLANYIRIFEPMVIKSLKEYTITSDVKLQCKVLRLLSQLIQLRVNYCLLDSEQVFIQFVLKQFEYIEEGQVPYANKLIPKIFQFLVQLSYSKQHSKSIISIPKIIQMCDGLMASGQFPVTHCIPALEPIVQDIFLMRNKSNTFDIKELETTREVILSMLLRLSGYHEVIDLIVLILDDSRYCNDNFEKWLRWSTQVVNVIFPMLKQNKVKLDSSEAFISLRNLIFVLNPNVFEPLDNIILLLFQGPPEQENSQFIYNRWLAKILIVLLILSPFKDDVLISKISDLKADFPPSVIFENVVSTADPLNVTNSSDIFCNIAPEDIFTSFLFKVINITSKRCVQYSKSHENEFLVEELSMFLMYCLYFFQSGSHCRITSYIISKLSEMNVEPINNNFLKIVTHYPVLTFLWCYFLTLLNYGERTFWSAIMFAEKDKLYKYSLPINCKIVKTGGAILFCDYMTEDVLESEQLSWFLNNYVSLLVHLCNETPVFEFISSVHRNIVASKVLIDSIAKNCVHVKDPVYITKLLRFVENTHPRHTAILIKLMLPKLLTSRQLALSRIVANLASRKLELLLTMSMEDVNAQLSKEDLMDIINTLQKLKLVKKHEGLSSLLNKLCTQYYDVSPLELDQKRSVNPEYIKKLKVNRNWFLSQIKGKCDVTLNKETAELLFGLDHDELSNLMLTLDFNKSNLRECIRFCVDVVRRDKIKEEPPLLKVSISCLLTEIAKICDLLPREHQVYRAYNRNETTSEVQFSDSVTKLFEEVSFLNSILEVTPSITSYIKSLRYLPKSNISSESVEVMARFGVLCLESVNYLIDVDRLSPNINSIDLALSCSNLIFKSSPISNILGERSHISLLSSAVNSLYKLTEYFLLANEKAIPLVPKYELKGTMENSETASAGQACFQLYNLVCWLYRVKDSIVNVPKFLLKPIKSIIISLSRLPCMYSYLLIPAKVWKSGWTPQLQGVFHTQVPPLPIELLQEIDILEEFMYRIALLGWTSRQQFEETWMSFLSVLCNSTKQENQTEINDIVHSSSLAVKAITSLLLQTLHYPKPGNANVSELIHIPRDVPIWDQSVSYRKLKRILDTMAAKYGQSRHMTEFVNMFSRPNFEKQNISCYSYNQISVKYLLIATNSIQVEDSCPVARVWRRREDLLQNIALDLNSCLQFLLDYYSQVLKQQTPNNLRFVYEIVRSIITISDLFTDKTQFSWMLDMFFELSKIHTIEDELIHQYLIVGICKSAAILTPDLETYENIKRILVQYLKSSFLPSRVSCLHGFLYLLEGCKLSNINIGGISDEMQLILPCIVEYVRSNINSIDSLLKGSQEHTLLVWSITFYLIENVDEIHMESNFVTNSLQVAVSLLLQKKINITLQTSLMQGLERLIISRKLVVDRMKKRFLQLALEKLRSDNSGVSILGQQLLLTYMYTDCREYLERPSKSASDQTNPDYLVQSIEKISALFEHVKRGYGFEVEVLCSVLPDILNDFFSPADILTKVINEFLSPQQPYPKLLSRVVFKVFERAIAQQQLALLQDWVVFSLSNITQSLSAGMATWCLTCFFISASSNEWLRMVFPYVQARAGRYEYEDRKMLCIAGADFYNNLTNDKQKKTFIENFNKIRDQPDTLFSDLLCSL